MAQRPLSLKAFYIYTSIAKKLYYRHCHYIGMQNIPPDGNPVVMVGNHQNCMMDPLNVEWAMRDRKPYCLVRGDVFVNRIVGSFLHWIGLLPVQRLNFEGFTNSNAKEANGKTFEVAEEHLLAGNTIILFPEAGHQDKRWLGYFSLGYLTMAFNAAEKSDFKQEIYIMPFAHHYENYHLPRYDFALRMGTPIPLSPFYKKYQEKPRTTMREVNSLVEQQIGSLMLNITNLNHYFAIDTLRCSSAGRDYALRHGFNPRNLPERWESDKQFCQMLSSNEETVEILNEARTTAEEIVSGGLRTWVVEKQPHWIRLIAQSVLMTLLSPLALVAMLCTFLLFLVPHFLYKKKINGAIDIMFRSTWQVGAAIFIGMPLMWLLPTFILLFICWQAAVIYLVAWPFLFLFLSWYLRFSAKTIGIYHYLRRTDRHHLSDQWQTICNKLPL